MKIIVFAALVLAIGTSASGANPLAASPRAEGVRFAAMSLTKDQSMRAIISNVLVPPNGSHLAPCQVQVSFFGPDGSLIGTATTVELKAGESTSVPASNPSKLVRATVSISDVVDPAKVCALRTSVEIFDVQTGMTFVSVSGDSVDSNSERSVSVAPVIAAVRRHVTGRENIASVAASTSPSVGMASPKPRPSTVTPPIASR